jgi:hypothetical protein
MEKIFLFGSSATGGKISVGFIFNKIPTLLAPTLIWHSCCRIKKPVVALDERLEPASQPPPKRAEYTALYFFSRSGKPRANNHLFRHDTNHAPSLPIAVAGSGGSIRDGMQTFHADGNEIRFRSS